MRGYEYVVVGAGSAGCVLAARLSEDGVRVLLLEAGGADAIEGAEVPEDVQHQRWAMDQLIRATLVDETIAHTFSTVAFMLAHPFSLADPALVEQAVAANQRACAVS